MPLPLPIAGGDLWIITIVVVIIIIIIIVIIPQMGKSYRTIDLLGILGYLQLKVSSKLNQLLMLLHSGLNLKRIMLKQILRDAKEDKTRQE